jgi:hypothetical protein
LCSMQTVRSKSKRRPDHEHPHFQRSARRESCCSIRRAGRYGCSRPEHVHCSREQTFSPGLVRRLPNQKHGRSMGQLAGDRRKGRGSNTALPAALLYLLRLTHLPHNKRSPHVQCDDIL